MEQRQDSAWALHVLRQAGEAAAVGLLTTFDAVLDHVAMHAIHRELIMSG